MGLVGESFTKDYGKDLNVSLNALRGGLTCEGMWLDVLISSTQDLGEKLQLSISHITGYNGIVAITRVKILSAFPTFVTSGYKSK